MCVCPVFLLIINDSLAFDQPIHGRVHFCNNYRVTGRHLDITLKVYLFFGTDAYIIKFNSTSLFCVCVDLFLF